MCHSWIWLNGCRAWVFTGRAVVCCWGGVWWGSKLTHDFSSALISRQVLVIFIGFQVWYNKIMSFAFGQGLQTACQVVEDNESSSSREPVRSGCCTCTRKVAQAAPQSAPGSGKEKTKQVTPRVLRNLASLLQSFAEKWKSLLHLPCRITYFSHRKSAKKERGRGE